VRGLGWGWLRVQGWAGERWLVEGLTRGRGWGVWWLEGVRMMTIC